MRRSLLILVLIGSLGSLSSAAAQTDGDGPMGITVTGSGLASAPADSATVELVISDLSAMYSGMPAMPEVEATPGARATAAVSSVVDAVSAIEDVGDLAIAIPPATSPFGGPSPLARLTLTVAAPTQDQLLDIVTSAVQSAAGENLTVSHVGALFATTDCASLERTARQAALDDARERAGIQADLIGASLGDIVSMVDEYYGYGMGMASAGCEIEVPGSMYLGDPFSGATLPAFDPTRDAVEVEVFRVIRVSFAIASGEATPAA